MSTAGCGVRTHACLCTEDLKSSPLTTRANQLVAQGFINIYMKPSKLLREVTFLL